MSFLPDLDAQNAKLQEELETVRLAFRNAMPWLPAYFAVLILLVTILVCGCRSSFEETATLEVSASEKSASELPPAEAAVRELDGAESWQGWQLCKELRSGERWLRTYTRKESGMLAFRFHGCVDASVSEYLVMVQEFDLLPSWIPFCSSACTLRQASPNEFVVYCDFDFHLWPLPQVFAVLDVVIDVASCDDKRVAATFCSPSAADFDRAAVPSAARAHAEVPLKLAVARFTPQPSADGVNRTEVEVVSAVELQALTFLGPARWAMRSAPQWLISLAVSILVPHVWAQYLAALAALRQPGSPFSQRMTADKRGFYAGLRSASGQPA